MYFDLCGYGGNAVGWELVEVFTYVGGCGFDVFCEFLLHLLNDHLVSDGFSEFFFDVGYRFSEVFFDFFFGSDL